MTVNKNIILFIAITTCCLSFGCGCGEDDGKVNEYDSLYIPIYNGAEGIEMVFRKRHLIKGARYNLVMQFPAKDIIDFYNAEMRNIKFQPYPSNNERDILKNWNTYVDGTIEGAPDVTQFSKSWVNSEKTKRANLILQYYWYEKEKTRVLNSATKLKVAFSIQPYYKDPEKN